MQNQGAPTPPAASRQFSIEDAKRIAREEGARSRYSKSDTAVAQLAPSPDRHSLTSKLERGITKAARPDCKDSIANTGLFAVIIVPITIVRDMNDTGCKW
jgi:hypothetical protein